MFVRLFGVEAFLHHRRNVNAKFKLAFGGDPDRPTLWAWWGGWEAILSGPRKEGRCRVLEPQESRGRTDWPPS